MLRDQLFNALERRKGILAEPDMFIHYETLVIL